jgi:hypothetical protein
MKHTIKALYGDMKPWGKVWLYTGIVTLIVAAAMSVDFGWSVSSKHALFLGCLSLVAAFLPDAARDQWKHESKPMGFILGLVAVPLLLIEFGSHAGYTAGLRGNNISESERSVCLTCHRVSQLCLERAFDGQHLNTLRPLAPARVVRRDQRIEHRAGVRVIRGKRLGCRVQRRGEGVGRCALLMRAPPVLQARVRRGAESEGAR